MWYALLIVMLANGEMSTATSTMGFKSEADCKRLNAAVEVKVNADEDVKAYVLKCVEVSKDEIKVNGKPV
jgi:hypothetical protein